MSKGELKASEQAQQGLHLAAALANVTDAVITTNASDRITYMNFAAQTLTGRQLQEAAGELLANVFSIVHADGGGPVESVADTAKRTEEGDRVLQRAVLVGETDRPVVIEYSVAAIRDAEGVLAGAVTVFRDITHRRAAELALQSSEETLFANAEALFEEKERAQVTLNSIGDAVVSTDFRGRVTFLNIVAENMTGWTQAEASGRLLDEIFFFVDARTREHIPCPAMRAIIENRTVGLGAPSVLIRRDGVEIAVEDSASPIHDKNGGVVGAVMVAHDVTVARDLAAKLARLALHDNLTDLPNRALFADRLDQALVRAHRGGNFAALLFVDLDRFKAVNDSLGHAIGDRLLQAVADRLLTCVRGSDTVSRYGGDEFIILLADVAHAEDAAVCAEKVNLALDKPYELNGQTLRISASIGIASFPEHATDAETLLKYADIAMYHAKHSGSNNYKQFSPEMISGDRPMTGRTLESVVHKAADHSFHGVKETVASKRELELEESRSGDHDRPSDTAKRGT
jgi:diguanylate cyclase (GGDEF)-like protein/PAS domain S-box-containing protein